MYQILEQFRVPEMNPMTLKGSALFKKILFVRRQYNLVNMISRQKNWLENNLGVFPT